MDVEKWITVAGGPAPIEEVVASAASWPRGRASVKITAWAQEARMWSGLSLLAED